MTGQVRVTHIINGLAVGGAENMLFSLLTATDKTRFRSEVISLLPRDKLADDIEGLGIPVRSVGISRKWPNPARLLTLAAWLRASQPNVIQTWLPQSDLAGGLAAFASRRVPVVWGVHHTDPDVTCVNRRYMRTIRACARLSHLVPKAIVCCSEATRQMCERQGYDARKLRVIPNGFKLQKFALGPEVRAAVRAELGIGAQSTVIGHFARFNPQKDHGNLISAAIRLQSLQPEIEFLLCGYNVTMENPALRDAIAASPRPERFHLLGFRADIARLLSAIDIGTLSSSYGEAFPLTIGEAMASGKPCVATDVGDSASLIGETGFVVPRRDPEALAEAWRSMALLPESARAELGAHARNRIKQYFGLDAVAGRYEALYGELASGRLLPDSRAVMGSETAV